MEASRPERVARFLGEYRHTLDAKGRLILPAKFREAFAEKAFITKLVDGCLAIWTPEEFDKMQDEMVEKGRRGQAERNVMRVWAAGAVDVVPDRQNRVAIPQHLREFAGLDGDVVVNGAINHVEVWNPDRWRDIDESGSQGLAAGAEALSDMAF